MSKFKFSNDPHPFGLQGSDNPSMPLVSASLTGGNYLAWSRSMTIALRVKNKLGFINGSLQAAPNDSPNFEKWLKVDSMAISWILNSILKDMVESFSYADTKKDLWDEFRAEIWGMVFVNIDIDDKLMQFLISLNDSYDHRQKREVPDVFGDLVDHGSAMLAKTQYFKKDATKETDVNKGNFKKKKEDRFCDHCKVSMDTRETCFKLHGYPN
ncbi:uncharacterized protein LOC110638680 [Hevea brasiliensis]|uniref:uncharacterized protein LOC110638680 n=1 Tax=Hevea brasiliensis TaxID=3981 RepID=UPI0025E72F3A|nr:uncharacterized protein LOC110638680 [Hevea brasiliensis]